MKDECQARRLTLYQIFKESPLYPRRDDLDRFVSKARHRALCLQGDSFSGFTFGKSAIVARIYDKTLEILGSDKEWMRVLWDAAGYDASVPVWRLEFQFRRTALRELGIVAVSDLVEQVGALWAYATRKWLRLSVPLATSHKERWPTDPVWHALSAPPGFADKGGDLIRVRRNEHQMERTLRGALGYLTSYAASIGVDALPSALRSLEAELESRLRSREEESGNLVRVKREGWGPSLDQAEASAPWGIRGVGGPS